MYTHTSVSIMPVEARRGLCALPPSTGAGVTGSYEPPYMGAGNWTQVLCKSSKYSTNLSGRVMADLKFPMQLRRALNSWFSSCYPQPLVFRPGLPCLVLFSAEDEAQGFLHIRKLFYISSLANSKSPSLGQFQMPLKKKHLGLISSIFWSSYLSYTLAQ